MALNKKHVLGCLAIVLLLLIVAAVLIAVYRPEWLKPPAPKQPTTSTTAPPSSMGPGRSLVLMTWNVRGYPEKDAATRTWFSKQLADLAPGVLCIQEISDQSKITTFMSAESRFIKYAFSDSSDGQDNAIFVDSAADIKPLATPAGFQHPAAVAYVTSDGFDAVVVTVHLSWTDVSKRAREKQLLRGVVADALKIDPDVIVTGDFNTQRPDIDELAADCGLKVMVPGNVATAATTHAGSRYDWVLISPDLASEEAIGAEIVSFSGSDLTAAKKASDHLPVRAQFSTDQRFKDRK